MPLLPMHGFKLCQLLIQVVCAGPNGKASADITGSQLGKLFALHDRLVTIASEGKARAQKGEGGSAQVSTCSQDLQQFESIPRSDAAACLLLPVSWTTSLCSPVLLSLGRERA